MKKIHLLFLSIFLSVSLFAQTDTTNTLKWPEAINMTEVRMKIGYPAIAREAGIMGDVILNITVDVKGEYVSHSVLCSAHPVLLKEIEKHIASLKFTPATLAGKPTRFTMEVPFKFKLMGDNVGEVKLINKEQLIASLEKKGLVAPNYTEVKIHLNKEGKYESHTVLWQTDKETGDKVIEVLKNAQYEVITASKMGYNVYILVAYKKVIGTSESNSKQLVNISYFQEL